MDQRKTKRPRSSTPTKGSGGASAMLDFAPTKKKSKTTKSKARSKAKQRKGSVDSLASGSGGSTSKKSKLQHGANPPNDAADDPNNQTEEGPIMAQMLSTFSKLEQSRFEAFQRVSFPAQAVGRFVAARLADQWRMLSTQPPSTSTRTTTRTTAAATAARPVLSDLVAVGAEGEISMVVSVLAKIYAQRLVQTAARNRQRQGDTGGDAAASTTNVASPMSVSEGSTAAADPNNTGGNRPLQPHEILRAHQERRALGLDPGFFLQSADERGGGLSSSHSSTFHHHQARLAALHAQEEYDERIRTEQQQQQEEEEDGDDANDVNKETVADGEEQRENAAMEVDEPDVRVE